MWNGEIWAWLRSTTTPWRGGWKKVKLLTHFRVASAPGSHFTGALAQNARENESITGLVGDKIRIMSIDIQSDQKLDYYLMFWRDDGYDGLTGLVHCDLITHARRIGGAGQYFFSIEGVDLDYDDEDETKEIHVSLYNASATAKAAGAAGDLTIAFKYELRE